LILVGAMMVAHGSEIDWQPSAIAIPAFLTLPVLPLTFSIANGLALGLVAHTPLTVAAGRPRQISPLR